MFNNILFNENIPLGDSENRYYLGKNGQEINATRDSSILNGENVLSSNLKPVAHAIQSYLNEGKCFKDKSFRELTTLKKNLEIFNQKIGSWNASIIFGKIFSINLVDLNSLDTAITNRARQEENERIAIPLILARESEIRARVKEELNPTPWTAEVQDLDPDIAKKRAEEQNLKLIEHAKVMFPERAEKIDKSYAVHASKDPRNIKVVLTRDSFEILDKEELAAMIKVNTEFQLGDLRTAKYVFLGDTHTDLSQVHVRTAIFKYLHHFYPVERDAREEILREGKQNGSYLDVKNASHVEVLNENFNKEEINLEFSLIISEKVCVNGWEQMELYNRHFKILKKIINDKNVSKIRKEKIAELKIEFQMLLKEYKKNPNQELRNKLIDLNKKNDFLKKQERSFINAINSNSAENRECMRLRNDAMIVSAKSAGEGAARVFIVAGSLHLKDEKNGYDVQEFSGLEESAVSIPKKKAISLKAGKSMIKSYLD